MTIETANRLYELRKKHNLSQEELAEKLGVSRQAVSKWERSEASPDTDNLIGLAKIYGLSLDELIYGEQEKGDEPDGERKESTKAKQDSKFKQDAQAEQNSRSEQDARCEEPSDTQKDNTNTPLLTVEDGSNKVTINQGGIVVEDEKGDTVKIGINGIKIQTNSSSDDTDYDDDDKPRKISLDGNGHIKINVDEIKNNKVKFWLEVPYAIICAVAYLIFGFYNICGGWAQSWIIFITIPIYYSLVEAIYERSPSEFSYPVLTAFIYLYFGIYQGNWHPSWIVFATIPIYYPIADAIESKIRRKDEDDE